MAALGLRAEDALDPGGAARPPRRAARAPSRSPAPGSSASRQEIRNLQRTEVREVSEPFASGEQKGSSAMPHKRNPILSERICGLARVLRGYAQVGLENVALWHERDISHSGAERVVLPDATIALDYMQHLAVRVIEGDDRRRRADARQPRAHPRRGVQPAGADRVGRRRAWSATRPTGSSRRPRSARGTRRRRFATCSPSEAPELDLASRLRHARRTSRHVPEVIERLDALAELSAMRLVMCLKVRDEADIIEDNLRYHRAQGVDFFIVTDNGSVDGTLEILRRWERDGRSAGDRGAGTSTRTTAQDWVTRMARLAATDHGADWVLHARCRRVLVAARRRTSATALGAIPRTPTGGRRPARGLRRPARTAPAPSPNG